MKIAYVLYSDFTGLDLVGPYEVISRWPDAEVHFLARSLDPVRCDRGLTVIPTDTPQTLADPDLIVVPGSEKPLPVMDDHVLVDWLRERPLRTANGPRPSVPVQAYAGAGLLDGKKTTTHWGFRDNLRAMGIEVVGDRVVWQDNHISGAGVSAGIDMALALTGRVHGRDLAQSLQPAIEYDPSLRSTPARQARPTPARCASHNESCSATVPPDGHSDQPAHGCRAAWSRPPGAFPRARK
jgi:transcriptional regulator GlxA family with amidase domain